MMIACQKQEGIIIPQEEKVLVVNSSLSADSIIRVNLSYTQSITNNSSYEKVTSADIFLYDQDTVFMENLLNNGDGNYFTINTVSASKKYILKIIILDKIHWSSDSIPVKAVGFPSSIDSITFRNKPNFFQITYTLSDNQNYQNFYGFKLKHIFGEIKGNDTFQKEEWFDIETLDPILIEDINSKFSKKQLLFTDKYFNNNAVKLKFGTSRIINNGSYQTRRLILYTEQYTAKAFAYYSSVNEHLFYQNDPFSQPVSVKGNVSDAYGAFIGTNIKADTIDFKY